MEIWMYILIAVAVVLVIGLVVFLVLKANKKKKIEAAEKEVQEKISSSTSELADKFGGNDNILEITKSGSRVTVLVKDPLKIEKEAIKETIDNVMFMGSKVVFVIGSDSEIFKNLLESKVEESKKAGE